MLSILIGVTAFHCGGGGGGPTQGGLASGTSRGSVFPAPNASGVGNGPSPAASDGGPTSIPEAFASVKLDAYYDPNHNMANTCNSSRSITELFSIGVAIGNCDPSTAMCMSAGPVRVKDGEAQSGGVVNVKCSVTGTYDVNLQASLGSVGTLQIFGHVDATWGGHGLSADIIYQGSEYQANNSCTIAFTYGAGPVPQNPPIAPGRIWAHLICPQMGDPSGARQVILMDMSFVPEVCAGEADFVFENCTQ